MDDQMEWNGMEQIFYNSYNKIEKWILAKPKKNKNIIVNNQIKVRKI